jgi:hypothetical protein
MKLPILALGLVSVLLCGCADDSHPQVYDNHYTTANTAAPPHAQTGPIKRYRALGHTPKYAHHF